MDDEDYEALVSRGSWHFDRYAKRVEETAETGKRVVYMHRLLIKVPDDKQVDHINGDRLDNRKSNLRLMTIAENTARQHKFRGGSSRFKGVAWDKSRNRWKAYIGKDYRKIQLGRFDNEVEAAKAYDAAALGLFGLDAIVNFPEGG